MIRGLEKIKAEVDSYGTFVGGPHDGHREIVELNADEVRFPDIGMIAEKTTIIRFAIYRRNWQCETPMYEFSGYE